MTLVFTVLFLTIFVCSSSACVVFSILYEVYFSQRCQHLHYQAQLCLLEVAIEPIETTPTNCLVTKTLPFTRSTAELGVGGM